MERTWWQGKARQIMESSFSGLWQVIVKLWLHFILLQCWFTGIIASYSNLEMHRKQ